MKVEKIRRYHTLIYTTTEKIMTDGMHSVWKIGHRVCELTNKFYDELIHEVGCCLLNDNNIYDKIEKVIESDDGNVNGFIYTMVKYTLLNLKRAAINHHNDIIKNSISLDQLSVEQETDDNNTINKEGLSLAEKLLYQNGYFEPSPEDKMVGYELELFLHLVVCDLLDEMKLSASKKFDIGIDFVEMWLSGKPIREISKHFNISTTTIQKIISKARDTVKEYWIQGNPDDYDKKS